MLIGLEFRRWRESRQLLFKVQVLGYSMFLLRKPNPASMRRFLDDQASASFSYPEVGATSGKLPEGYAMQHTRKSLGHGPMAFACACDALRTMQQFQLGWVDCWPRNIQVTTGEQIAVLGHVFGLWWLNACRIAYTIDEPSGQMKFGYANGTLPRHMARGEERFQIDMDADETVWLDILAFSRPNTLLAKLGYPVLRRSQQRFGAAAVVKLQQLVSRGQAAPREERQG